MDTIIKNLRSLARYWPHCKRYAFLFFIIGTAAAAINLYEPMVAGRIMDSAFSPAGNTSIIPLALLWAGLCIIKYALAYLKAKISLYFTLTSYSNGQYDLFHRLMYASTQFFRTHSAGYIMARQSDDVFNLEGMFLNNIISGIIAIAEVLLLLAIMIGISPLLGVAAVILKSIDIISNFCFPLKQAYKNHNEAKAETSQNTQDVISHIDLVKIACREEFEKQRYKTYLKQYFDTWKRRDSINYLRRIITSMSADTSNIAIIVAGGILISDNQLSVGEVTAFFLFYQKLSSACIRAIPLIPLYKIAVGALERIHEFESQMGTATLPPGNRPRAPEPIVVKKEICFRHVTAIYDNRPVLTDLSLTIRPGMLTAIVGKSGAGKSTIANLLLRFLHESAGTITIDGIPLDTFSLSQLRRSISYLPQDTPLFRRTVYENITYQADSEIISPAAIQNAIQKAGAAPIIDHLDGGLSALIIDQGKNLSGGEKQRISIARELLKDAAIYIFDESTSALDTESEKIIHHTIKELAKTKPVIVIAHRLSIIVDADMIYVLDNGQVKECGTHESLLKHNGLYYRLFASQQGEG